MKNYPGDFWTISPDTQNKTTPVGYPSDTSVTDVYGSGSSPSGTEEKIKPKAEIQTGETYTSEHNPFLREITVTPMMETYHFYDAFVSQAHHVRQITSTVLACEPKSFFSLSPQYNQMDRGQTNWYFYFRQCVQKGNYPETPETYVFLLAFEILNTPDLGHQPEDMALLCRLWTAYRKTHTRLDRYFPSWIAEYGMIYHLAPTAEAIRVMTEEKVSCVLPEYFFFGEKEVLRASFLYDNTHALTNSTLYDKKEMPFLSEVQNAVFDVFLDCVFQDVKPDDTFVRTVLTFDGSVCASTYKRHLKIKYIPTIAGAKFRSNLMHVLRYTDNKMRAVFGVRSRLRVEPLDASFKAKIDACLEPFVQQKNVVKDDTPVYEKRYEVASTVTSSDEVQNIERASWLVTDRLVVEEEQDAITPIPTNEDASPKLADFAPYFIALLEGNVQGKNVFIEQSGQTEPALCECINTVAYDEFGDILLEETPNGWQIISDYVEDVRQMIQ